MPSFLHIAALDVPPWSRARYAHPHLGPTSLLLIITALDQRCTARSGRDPCPAICQRPNPQLELLPPAATSTVPHGASVLSHGCQTNRISMSPRLDPASGVARAMVILLRKQSSSFYHVTNPNNHHVTHVRTGSSANLFQGASVRARQSVPPRTVERARHAWCPERHGVRT